MKLCELALLADECGYFHVVLVGEDGQTTLATCDRLQNILIKDWLNYHILKIKPLAYHMRKHIMRGLEVKIRKDK